MGPFTIACDKCAFCRKELCSNCHESNPEANSVGGIFGYSYSAGGNAGGQAEYVDEERQAIDAVFPASQLK